MSVLMIGLDGATFTLLQRFCDEGVTPFLAGLIAGGTRATLMSTRNPLTPPAWTSMITGRSPEVHGVYDFLRPAVVADGSVYLRVNDSRQNRAETLWSMAGRGGRRVTALNFYGQAPAEPVAGYLVSGFVPWKHLRQGVHPPELFDRLKAQAAFDYRLLGMDIGEEKKVVQGLYEEGEHEAWIGLQNVRDAAWTELTCRLMAEDRTDLTAVVLDGPDKVQHLFWRFLDPAFARDDEDDWTRRMRALATDFYARMDANLRRMVEAAGPETDVIVVSDHGFGPTTEIVYINEWLARQGYLAWKDDARGDAAGHLTAGKIRDHLTVVDWQNTRAFCPTPSSNAIHVKTGPAGGPGAVAPEDYAGFCLELRRRLLEDLRDPVTGEAVVVGVDLNKMRGSGFAEPCPDLTLHLRDGGFVSILHADAVVRPRPHADGTHRPEGVFVGHGPSFAAGRDAGAFGLLDIAPLVLTLLDLPVPADLEGTVPQAVLAAARDVRAGAATERAAAAADEDEPSEEERAALLRQMKVLGYMD